MTTDSAFSTDLSINRAICTSICHALRDPVTLHQKATLYPEPESW